MTKLQVTGVSGVGIRAGQQNDSAKGLGFSCVNKAHIANCKPLSAGLDAIADEKRSRRDIIATAGTLSFVPDSKSVVVVIGDETFTPTLHAIKQCAGWAGKFPQTAVNYYLENPKRDNLDMTCLANCLNNGRKTIDPAKKFRFRTYSDGTLRAMLSTDYAPVDISWQMEQYMRLMPDAMLSHMRGDADDIYANILIPDSVRKEDDSDYGGLIAIGNSEIGRRRFSQRPGVFRWICFNGNIWDLAKGEIINVVHKGQIDLDLLRQRMADNLNEQIPMTAVALERLLGTKKMTFPQSETEILIAQVAKDNGFSPSQTRTVAEQFVTHESSFNNLFGIINAITRAGQLLDNDTWVSFDELGGGLAGYSDTDWSTLRNKAKYLTAKEVDKIYGHATAS